MPPNPPTFIPGPTSHLATDRHSFELHLEGIDPPNRSTLFPNTHSFRHSSEQIDITTLPPLVIQGVTCTNVDQALRALNVLINPSAQYATTTTPGIVVLGGDLAGNNTLYSTPRVSGLQSVPVSTQTPTMGQVLTFNGSQWAPATSGAFTASSDLMGNNTYQNVIGLTGDGYHNLRVSANNIQFVPTALPNISQVASSGSSGTNMTISAQGVSSGTGGQLILAGGQAGSGLSGGVSLNVGTSTTVFEATQINSPAQNVAAFFPQPTGLQMPTGSGVIYIGNTATPPTSPSPSGSILWSDAQGNLNVMPSNGNSFVVGSIPNPSIWESQSATSGESITYMGFGRSASSYPFNVFAYDPYTMPNNTCVRVDCILVGKEIGTTYCAQYNLSMGFIVDGYGNVSSVGSVVSTDSRSIPSVGYWNPPTISHTGTSLQVFTGYSSNATSSSNWTVVTQIILSPIS